MLKLRESDQVLYRSVKPGRLLQLGPAVSIKIPYVKLIMLVYADQLED